MHIFMSGVFQSTCVARGKKSDVVMRKAKMNHKLSLSVKTYTEKRKDSTNGYTMIHERLVVHPFLMIFIDSILLLHSVTHKEYSLFKTKTNLG